jgi:REP element-mobilizing transposase RayT
MPFNPDIHHRRSIRLPGYDYTTHGAYFITVCAKERQCLFGVVENGQMRMNEAGRVAEQCWNDIPAHFPHAVLDEMVVMPNHVHGIVWINGRGTACRTPTMEQFGQPVSGSISTIVRSFKSAVTKHINELHGVSGNTIWQRNFYERIIRNETELNGIREYIRSNPALWATDDLHVPYIPFP